MPTDTSPVRETSPVPSDKPRTYRAPDDLYESVADLALTRDLGRPRGEREALGGVIRLMLRAYRVNPDAMEREARSVLGEDS